VVFLDNEAGVLDVAAVVGLPVVERGPLVEEGAQLIGAEADLMGLGDAGGGSRAAAGGGAPGADGVAVEEGGPVLRLGDFFFGLLGEGGALVGIDGGGVPGGGGFVEREGGDREDEKGEQE